MAESKNGSDYYGMKKIILNICGLSCVVLAGIGTVVPGLPTTPFLLVAAACFAKSSPKLHNWLLTNKVFGPIIKNWQETRTIPKRAKWISLITVILVATCSIFTLNNVYLKAMIVIILIFPIIFLFRLKETEAL